MPQKPSFTSGLKKTFQLLLDKKMRRVLPAMVWASLSLATFAGSFVTLMADTMDPATSPNRKLELSLLAMIPLGIGQMLGGALIG